MSFNLQSAICGLQSAVCSLQSAVCSLQSAVCSLRSAVCKCHTLPLFEVGANSRLGAYSNKYSISLALGKSNMTSLNYLLTSEK